MSAESDLSQQRRRVRDKQKIMMELIKQQVSLKKLKRRNQEAEQRRHDENQNSLITDIEGSFTDYRDT